MEPRITLTLSSVGQITIPRKVRKLLNLEKGAELELEVNKKNKTITLTKQPTINEVMDMLDEIDKKYPMYEFKKHKGYPTKKHLELLEKYGVLDIYRTSYKPVKKILEKEEE